MIDNPFTNPTATTNTFHLNNVLRECNETKQPGGYLKVPLSKFLRTSSISCTRFSAIEEKCFKNALFAVPQGLLR
jgi:hypothetical protein